MKTIKFYSIFVLIVFILVLSFQNFAYTVIFYFLLSTLNTPVTIPMLMMAILGTGLGWILRSYLQDLKNEEQEAEYELEDSDEETEAPEAEDASVPKRDESDLE